MVEKDARTGKNAVALPVVHRDPMAVDLRDAVGAARPKGRLFVLRLLLDVAEHLAAAGLIEPDCRIHQANGLQHPRDTQRGELAGQQRL